MTYIEAQGAALKELRKRKRLTIVEVTNKMNKTVQWLSAIELGKRNLYFDDAKALCKIYRVYNSACRSTVNLKKIPSIIGRLNELN